MLQSEKTSRSLSLPWKTPSDFRYCPYRSRRSSSPPTLSQAIIPNRRIFLGGLQLRTAGNIDVLAGYPAAVVGSEKCGGARNVIRLPNPAESGSGNGKLPDFRLVQEIRAHISFGKAWRERIHGDASWAKLFGEFESQDVESAFGHGVRSLLGKGCVAKIEERTRIGSEADRDSDFRQPGRTLDR